MNLSCSLFVDGEFDGIIHSKKDINIGKNGHIKGEVVVQRLVVQGFIEGNISAQRVEIKANGKVSGTIEYEELVIEAKGILEGKSIVKSSKQAPKVNKIELNKS